MFHSRFASSLTLSLILWPGFLGKSKSLPKLLAECYWTSFVGESNQMLLSMPKPLELVQWFCFITGMAPRPWKNQNKSSNEKPQKKTDNNKKITSELPNPWRILFRGCCSIERFMSVVLPFRLPHIHRSRFTQCLQLWMQSKFIQANEKVLVTTNS